MKIEEIIKILWRRKFYILLPMLFVPLFTAITITKMTKEYKTHSIVFINESLFRHPTLLEFGLKINIEERLPSIKKMMKRENLLCQILGEKKKKNPTYKEREALAKKKESMVVELKGPGIAKISYSGTDPVKIKGVVERMADAFIDAALQPYEGIGVKLREKLIRRDQILSVQILPQLNEAKTRYHELKKSFTDQSPDLIAAKFEYERWLDKSRIRKEFVSQKVKDILPLKSENPDISQIATILEPATVPLIPFKPHKVKLLVIGVLVGVGLGFILTFIMEFLDHSFKETGDVEKYLGIPVVGRVPKI